MITFPNAKINLGLNILSKRDDGYHNISSCFYPLPFSDILEIMPSENFHFRSTGITIPNDGENLCIKAFRMLKDEYGIGNVNVHLHKNIPIGAGLGGGSADASFALKMMNELFELSLTDDDLEKFAGRLGSDCPFFIRNKPVLAEGVGTDFRTVDVDLSGKYLVLINPGIHVSTALAYSKVLPNQPEKSIEEILKLDITKWQEYLVNDFEDSVFRQFPAIKKLKKQLIASGALYASMSGSGSSVYGIFEEAPKIPSNLDKDVCWKGLL